MTTITEVWTNRSNLRETKTVTHPKPELAEGEVLMKIEKFGLTANNVSYAITGDSIGYWGYYPAEGEWGKVPAWGFAEIIESKCESLDVGERIWGFLPMASHVVMRPVGINDSRWFDGAPHRAKLPPMYNQVMRTSVEPEILKTFENERSILFPLFATSFCLYDFLIDNDFFGADQVLIGSASSKTGFGLAHMLFNDQAVNKSIVGITSNSNAGFCRELGCFDEVVVYDEENELDPSVKTVFVDMSGNLPLTVRLHTHFGDNMLSSWKVGATHWEAEGESPENLPGAKSRFFFAPKQMGKRDQDWGPGKFWEKAFIASIGVTKDTARHLHVEHRSGAETAAATWVALLDNQVPGSTGLSISI